MRTLAWIALLALIACSKTGEVELPSPCEGKCDTWGADDRSEPYELAAAFVERYGRSVGMLIQDSSLTKHDDGSAELSDSVSTIGKTYGLCSDVRYADQPAAGSCSGFFAGNDIFVTAGHCLAFSDDPTQANAACERLSVVFDFAYLQRPEDPVAAVRQFSTDNLYRCKEVLLHHFDIGYYSTTGPRNDMAILRLDRPVVGRTGMPMRHSGEIQPDEQVFMVGHPSGLPAKFALNGKVMPSYFSGQGTPFWTLVKGFFFDLDLFGGNSGGPIFNTKTGLVEGVAHAYTGMNFTQRAGESCLEVGVCGQNVTCPIYPGAYPVTEYADAIDRAVAGQPVDFASIGSRDGGTHYAFDFAEVSEGGVDADLIDAGAPFDAAM